MSHDGEVFYYRPDRSVRTGSAVSVRPPIREPYDEPEPDALAPSVHVREDRFARLEAMVEQLGTTVMQLAQVVQGMAARPAPESRPRPEAPLRGEPVVQYLRPEEAESEMAGLGMANAPQPPAEESVKVSMYAGGGATAIVGQIRVIPDA